MIPCSLSGIYCRFALTVAIAMLSTVSHAAAAVTINAACEFTAEQGLTGSSKEQSFVVASLSKIFTTQWALEIIGYDYRYETNIHIDAVSKNEVDVHIRGGGDPTWGRERLHHLVSELDRLGVRKIRTLTFDENFILSWRSQPNVIDKVNHYYDFTDLAGAETIIPSSVEIQKSLKTHFLPRKKEYANTLKKAKLAQVSLVESLQISAPKNISFRSSQEFILSPTATNLQLFSLPLFQILKLMNVTSNNFLADMLFEQIGGALDFADFIKSSILAPYINSFHIKNGSGYPIKQGENKFYNRASCAGVITALRWIDEHMSANGLGLEYVFPVAGNDPGTLDKYELPTDVMIAKTGTVNPTIAFAGMILTTSGPLYFSHLVKTDSNQDWPEARAVIKKYLIHLIQTQAVPLGAQPSMPLFWAENSTSSDVKPL